MEDRRKERGRNKDGPQLVATGSEFMISPEEVRDKGVIDSPAPTAESGGGILGNCSSRAGGRGGRFGFHRKQAASVRALI